MKWVRVAAAVLLLVVVAVYVFWWRDPKRSENGLFARAAGPGAFKFADIPRDRDLSEAEVEEYANRAVGQELRAQGANFFGGVCIDVLRHPGWGRAQETFGEDPYLLREMAAATIEGVQRHNVMACAKHFALNSIDEPRNVIDVRVDERTLREVYLPQFKRAVDTGVAAVMRSYDKVNGDYAAENQWLLRTVLKKEWGFRGFVMSAFFRGVYDGPKAARAGLDIEMPLARQYGPAFLRDVETGAVAKSLVDEAVRRIQRRKTSYLARRDPQTYDASLVVSPEHVALAREVAEKSIVLLENEGALFPLDKASSRTAIAVACPCTPRSSSSSSPRPPITSESWSSSSAAARSRWRSGGHRCRRSSWRGTPAWRAAMRWSAPLRVEGGPPDLRNLP